MPNYFAMMPPPGIRARLGGAMGKGETPVLKPGQIVITGRAVSSEAKTPQRIKGAAVCVAAIVSDGKGGVSVTQGDLSQIQSR